MSFELSSDLGNAEMGAFFASLFRFFNITGVVDTRNQVTQRMRPFFGNDMRDFFASGGPTGTSVWIGTDSNWQVVIIDGVRTNIQATNLITGYSGSISTFSFQGRNEWLRNAGRNVAGFSRQQALLLGTRRQLIVGYSAGGATAWWAAKQSMQDREWVDQRVLTFGAPRAMSTPDLEAVNALESVRWMVDSDPIPLVPPRFEAAPVLALALGVNATLTHGTFVHKNPGFSLAQDGTATLTELPLVASADVTGSLANWYFSKANDPTNTHQSSEYEARLTALRQLQMPRPPAEAARQPPEAPEQANRREHRAAAERVAAQIANAASDQNKNPVVVRGPVLMKAQRFGRIWCVAFGDQLFAYAGNKKRARHLARVGNDFLRSLPKQAVVDPDSLLEQLTNFFNAAVLPGGPVSPPIRIGL